jgi:hypothetical protein
VDALGYIARRVFDGLTDKNGGDSATIGAGEPADSLLDDG